MSNRGRTMNHKYRTEHHSNRQHGRSLIGSIFRGIVIVVLVIGALSGGLWLLGAALGLAFGLVSLLVAVAPLLFVAWVVWIVLKAVLS